MHHLIKASRFKISSHGKVAYIKTKNKAWGYHQKRQRLNIICEMAQVNLSKNHSPKFKTLNTKSKVKIKSKFK